MDRAIQEAKQGVIRGEGGPFGAVMVQMETGKVVASAHNMVLQTNDPTAHAEVTCIRLASAKLGRFDLSDCVLYSSCQPCPMCFGAIHWAKIPVCYYAATDEDAAEAGFSDASIYRAIRGGPREHDHCHMEQLPHPEARSVFQMDYGKY